MKFKYDNSILFMSCATWLAVTFSTWLGIYRSEVAHLNTQVYLAAIQLITLIAILFTLNEYRYQNDFLLRVMGLLVQSLCFFISVLIINYDFLMIFNIMLTTQLRYFLSFKLCSVYIFLSTSTFVAIQAFYWEVSSIPFMTAALYMCFHYFALTVTEKSIKAENAEKKALLINRELLATQNLLQQSSTQNERLRIARELHDSIGHQLTALIIKLDVARRQLDDTPPKKQGVEECYLMAKILLKDVRNVVSDHRLASHFDLSNALVTLAEQTPKLNLIVNVDERIKIEDVQTAHTILRCCQECVTNTLKHTMATDMSISLIQDHTHYALKISDNGKILKKITPGNGILGMRERVEELGGKLHFSGKLMSNLSINITLPLTPKQVQI